MVTKQFPIGWAEEAGRKAGLADRDALRIGQRASGSGREEESAKARKARLMAESRFEAGQVSVDVALKIGSE